MKYMTEGPLVPAQAGGGCNNAENSSAKRIDVLIVGGGIVGLTSAIAMAARGFSVTVLDKASFNLHSRRVYAINTASQRLLAQLGVWCLLPEHVFSPYRHMHVWDTRTDAYLDFHARDLARPELGFIFEETILREALLMRAQALSITLISGAGVAACIETPRGIRVTTEEGSTWNAMLCMIADGANSSMRQLLNVPLTTWSYHQDALVATISTEKPHQKTAYQAFCADGPLAFLPLKDAHQCSIVWSHPPERIQALMALDECAFERELTKAFSAKLGQLRVFSERSSFPLRMRHVKQYVGNSWMLLGDAAHTIHPLAGLGLNVGLADLNAWLSLLDAEKSATWSPRMLAAYQRERKDAVWAVIALMQSIKCLFGVSALPISFIRGMGIRTLNQLSPIKQLFMMYAAGEGF